MSTQRTLKSIACLFAVLLAYPSLAAPADVDQFGAFSRSVTGDQFEYTVQPGDYLIKIGARFGVSARILAQENGLDYDGILRPGRKLRVSNLHIVPPPLPEGILINLPQRMLFFFSAGELNAFYPVGLGRPDWPTPSGSFSIASLQEDKEWIVPKSIQEEMRREGQVVRTKVPPGPDNPLGRHWIGLSLAGYGIHGTIAPPSVYHFQSHGCIRLHPDDIKSLFTTVKVGMKGRIIYTPVLLAQLPDSRIFLEIHGNIYRKAGDPLESARRLAEDNGLAQHIDWDRVAEVIRRQEGLAREVTLVTAVQENGQR